MVNKTTFKQYLLEAKMPEAESKDDLIASIVNGKFTKDGSKLNDWNVKYVGTTLTSLVGSQTIISGDFTCSNNTKLTSLVGGPQSVGSIFSCDVNRELTSLEGAPQWIGNEFYCENNPKLTSLARINFYIHEIRGGYAYFTGCPIKSNVLGLLKISGLKKVYFDDKKLEEIMNKYLPMGDFTDCIDDLLDAGYSKEYCKW